MNLRLSKKGFAVAVLGFLFAAFPFFLFLKPINLSNVQPPPPRKIILGAWTEGLFDPVSKTLHPEKLLEFENLVQKKVSIAHYYLGWEYLASPKIITQFNTLRSNNWQPMLNVNPYFFDSCPPTGLPLYQSIAEGGCDAFLHQAGKNLSKVDKPFYLLFAWEMNNKQNEWSVPYTRSSPEDFINAWRHMHEIFKSEGANNIIWVFCPNVPEDPVATYASLYPGDDYVDWIGLDGYNWGTTQSWSQWVSFSGVFTSSYNLLTQIAPNKPLVIAEVNTTDQGGDKSSWYKDMFMTQIPENFPQVSAAVIFNEDRSGQEKVNWKVDISEDSLKSFKEAINAPNYK